MGDFILGAVVIVDALVGLVTSQEFARVLFGAAFIAGFLLVVVALIAGFLLVVVALIAGALAAGRISLAAVVWLATRRVRP